jgi:hypothetical protein
MTPPPLSEPPPPTGSDRATVFCTLVCHPTRTLIRALLQRWGKNAPSCLALPFRAPLLRSLCSAAKLRAPLLFVLRSPPSGALPRATRVGRVRPVHPCHWLLPPSWGPHRQQPLWAFLRTSRHHRGFHTGVVFLFDSTGPSLRRSFDRPPVNNSTRPPSPVQAPPRWVSSRTQPQIGLPRRRLPIRPVPWPPHHWRWLESAGATTACGLPCSPFPTKMCWPPGLMGHQPRWSAHFGWAWLAVAHRNSAVCSFSFRFS